MAAAGAAVARVVAHCAPEDVAIVDNLTVAATAVADWLVEDCLAAGDALADGDSKRVAVVLVQSFTYGAVLNAFRASKRRLAAAGVRLELEFVELPFPVDKVEDIISAYERHLAAVAARYPAAALRLACLDHISSLPAIIFPVQQLVANCRAAGFARVFVDGAHAPGTVEELRVTDIGADFYAANLHKWLFAPSAAGFLYVKKDARKNLHHPVVSHHYDDGTQDEARKQIDGEAAGFLGECRMLGTKDYSPMLAVPAALDFCGRRLGGQRTLARRNRELALAAASLLSSAWGTRLGTPEELVGSTCMVGLPRSLGSSQEDGMRVRSTLLAAPVAAVLTASGGKYDSIVMQFCIPAAGRLWFRISAAAYNCIEDFSILRDAILALGPPDS